ncbi:outer membrane protein OmpA-like peptidoglycan-associated protein [Lipingzhangella halophila]|uniref:Outer membrane protein OmpA-like peptidoglycan-associated protein n=1 Tax=Lipingzhangella halophila TaxID=1783352 RepID=A0A7W7RNQ3_9ACTN|nr:OmpA family protein [Lipingzhangella halophila]MBB4935375.1 outer membrane protein OmpA-like peptidoglycan-associated protein [Lipingzhangella halophila]
MPPNKIRHGVLVLLASTFSLAACGTGAGEGEEAPATDASGSGADSGGGNLEAGGGEPTQPDVEFHENESTSSVERQVSETLSDLGAETRDGDTVVTLPDRVLFDTDEDTVRSDAEGTLDDLAEAIVFFDDAPVIVAGHTDSDGAKSYNQDLSERRAESVADYLDGAGVPEGSITSEGHGETDPVASNDDEDGRAENRRVEVVIEGVELDELGE